MAEQAGGTCFLLRQANIYSIAINPRNPRTLYAGTDNGVAQSTDCGETWSLIPGGPGRIRLLALDAQDPNTVYGGGPGGLFAISRAVGGASDKAIRGVR